MVESNFLGVPGVDVWLFAGLALASFLTSYIGLVTGAAGGLVLLTLLASIFPPAVVIPMHTFVQLGTGGSRVIIMRRYVLRGTLPPFLIGAVLGAAAGAQIFVALPTAVLQGAMGAFILIVAWMPKFTRVGAEGRRFAGLGFIATFLGMFVSATGTLIAPFVAGASPDRRNYVATIAALMASTHIIKLVAFGLLGVAMGAYAPLIVAMIATASLASWLGSRTLNLIPERVFRIIFQTILTALAIRLIWVGIRESGILP